MSDKPERAQGAQHGERKGHARGAACEKNESHSLSFVCAANTVSAAWMHHRHHEGHCQESLGALLQFCLAWHCDSAPRLPARALATPAAPGRVDPLAEIPPPLCSPRARPRTRKGREAQAQVRPIACRPATWAESTSAIPYFGTPARSYFFQLWSEPNIGTNLSRQTNQVAPSGRESCCRPFALAF